MRRKILIPYLMAGLGHFMLARAVAHHLREMRPDWEVQLMETADELNDERMRHAFIDLWRAVLAMPRFLQHGLFALERLFPGAARALNRRTLRTAVPKAAEFLALDPPDLILSAHWACSHLFSMARGDRTPPLYYVYGELDEAYSVAECGADVYFVLSQKVGDDLARMGVPAAAIRHIPVVVDPAIVRNGTPRDVLRRGLGIPPENLVVVLSMGGEGVGRTLPFVEAFAREAGGATLIVLTGRNKELLDRIRRRVTGPSVIPLGFQEDLSGIVASADVLAGKAGTGFAMMAMATGIPLIVTHLGAPNEAGNMRHIVENGHGWYCPRPRMFLRRVAELAREHARGEAGNAPRFPRQRNGAEDIAAAVVEALE